VRVLMILPALTEATSPLFRPIKYSLFPPLGLATLAGYLSPDDDVTLLDEHVERIRIEDLPTPDLLVVQAYITSARRSYEIADHFRARGSHVAMGGLHVTSLPDEAALHADSIFLGPGEDTWPAFLLDYRNGRPLPRYQSTSRTLAGLPPIRRDLIKRRLYLVPNSIVVSRGCPHHCDFCYKDAFFEGGKSFYSQTVDAALAEPPAGGRGADRSPRLGPLRHPPRRLPPDRDDAAATRGRLLARVPPLLPLVGDPQRRDGQARRP
jgi:radical SAM superfamily enzyme YgiQ (UPF0313 family)